MSVLGKIGVIGGTGWIGRAVVKQMLTQRFINANDVWVSNQSGSFSALDAWPNIHFTQDNAELIRHCDTVILSVRPQHVLTLALDLSKHLVMSVMAGVTTQRIAEVTGAKRIIRSMPNAAAEIGLSYTPWYATPQVDQATSEAVQALLMTFGKADRVSHEDQIDFFTALTGSGHGWVAYFESCLIRCAVNYGISADIAERAVRELFYGMGTLVFQEKDPVATTVEKLIDYAGTTAAGLTRMQQSPIASAIEESILAAYHKAKSDMTVK